MPGAVVANSGLREVLGTAVVRRSWVRLYRNDVDPTPTAPLLYYEACLFPDYADMEVTSIFGGATIDAVGRAVVPAFNLMWTRGAGGVPETVYGWVWYYGPALVSQVIAARRLTRPETLTIAGQSVVFSLIAYLLRSN